MGVEQELDSEYTDPIELSNNLDSTFLEYKNRIDNLISNNYGLEEEDEVLSFFKDIGIELSNRNNELLSILREKYGLNFLKELDFTGGIKFSGEEISDISDPDLLKFLNSSYVRKKGNITHSRGYGYYFNFPGFEKSNSNNFDFNYEKYFDNLSIYIADVFKLINKFNGKKISNLDENEKKYFLVTLEHYKNILMFFQNILIFFENKEHLISSGLNTSTANFKRYYEYKDLEKNQDYIMKIKDQLEKSIGLFSDILLNIENNDVIDLEQPIDDEIVLYLKDFFNNSFTKQKSFIEKLSEKAKSGKKTDVEGFERSITKSNKKLISNLIRIIREEDNPIKQLLSSHNIGKKIPEDINSLEINGLLYGGIEHPYIMKYVLNRFYGFDLNNMKINHVLLSAYHARNIKKVSNIENYPGNIDEEKKKLQIILDDNIFNASTINHSESLLSDKGPVISGVSEVGLRRNNLGKLKEGNNLQSLLSKVNYSASVTPIEKNRGTYINMVSTFIRKNLPNLAGKL